MKNENETVELLKIVSRLTDEQKKLLTEKIQELLREQENKK
jgi:hypothetical protein